MASSFRPQYSLATLMLTVTLAAMLMSLGVTYRKYRAVVSEIETYQKEADDLEISDPALFHVRQMHSVGSFHWTWRIYVPEDKKYVLRAITENIPAVNLYPSYVSNDTQPFNRNSLPPAESSLVLPRGECILDASLEKNDQGKIELVIRWGKEIHRMPLCGKQSTSDGSQNHSSTSMVTREKTLVESSHWPIFLLHWAFLVPVSPNYSISPLSSPSHEGLLLWVEEASSQGTGKEP
jgi:hypothetical protein